MGAQPIDIPGVYAPEEAAGYLPELIERIAHGQTVALAVGRGDKPELALVPLASVREGFLDVEPQRVPGLAGETHAVATDFPRIAPSARGLSSFLDRLATDPHEYALLEVPDGVGHAEVLVLGWQDFWWVWDACCGAEWYVPLWTVADAVYNLPGLVAASGRRYVYDYCFGDGTEHVYVVPHELVARASRNIERLRGSDGISRLVDEELERQYGDHDTMSLDVLALMFGSRSDEVAERTELAAPDLHSALSGLLRRMDAGDNRPLDVVSPEGPVRCVSLVGYWALLEVEAEQMSTVWGVESRAGNDAVAGSDERSTRLSFHGERRRDELEPELDWPEDPDEWNDVFMARVAELKRRQP